MREVFEARRWDGAARVGTLSVPRAGVTVETPALMPVVNPNLQTVSPSALETEFGAQVLITNAYIIHGDDELRETALDRGLHDMLDFGGAIVTDSGSFQLAEYGEIDVTTEEILRFQRDIGSDVGTPVDLPTPPDADRDRAETDLETTQERLALAESADTGEMLVNAPIQGSTHLDLRESAARHAYGTDLDVFPIGAVVPLLNEYRFADMVRVVDAAKRGLGADAPVHLFGAGHPMMFALAAAAGCDLFDSAAYALYARDDRYLTVRGTRHLDDLTELPCPCPICTTHDPDELRSLPGRERGDLLARHNLHVSFAELRRIREAIRAGTLLELVEERARAHPTMLDGYRALLDGADRLEGDDPATKGTFFHLSTESARRPEVRRHHERLDRLVPPEELVLTDGSRPSDRPAWRILPPFGPVPPELAETYPLTAEVSDRRDDPTLVAAADGIARLAAVHDVDLTVVHDGWPSHALDRLPDDVTTIDRSTDDDPMETDGDDEPIETAGDAEGIDG